MTWTTSLADLAFERKKNGQNQKCFVLQGINNSPNLAASPGVSHIGMLGVGNRPGGRILYIRSRDGRWSIEKKEDAKSQGIRQKSDYAHS
jgi:hypothetical protein